MGELRATGSAALCLLVLSAIVKDALSTGLGRCPVLSQLPNFDIKKMTGTWYEVERSFYLMEMSASCTELGVDVNERGYLLITINTTNRWYVSKLLGYKLEMMMAFHHGPRRYSHLLFVLQNINYYPVDCRVLQLSDMTQTEHWTSIKTHLQIIYRTGVPATTYGLGILSHTGASSFRYRLNNRMPYLIGRLLPGAGQYNVLATDYDQFALIWSCTSVSIAHSDRMWVLGRRRELEARVRAQIYGMLQQLGLDPDRLILSKNNNCTDSYTNTVN